MMRELLVVLACTAAVLAQEVAVEKALVHVQVDDYARLQAERLFKSGAPVQELQACRILQPYTLVVSGAIISPDGEIVTPALHPRASLRILVTTHDGAQHQAELCGTDPRSNLALVKIPVRTKHYLKLREAPLSEMLKIRVVGYSAYAPVPKIVEGAGVIGLLRYPLQARDLYSGRSRPVVMPVAVTVSALYPRLGALCVDEAGDLCGLRLSGRPPVRASDGTMKYEGHYLAAAPRIARVVADLREHGHVRRSSYGVRVVSVPASLQAHMPSLPHSAVAVIEVIPGQPAAAAGLRPNDVIVGLDGETFADVPELLEAMSDKPAGKPVSVDLYRKGTKISIEVTPVEAKEDG